MRLPFRHLALILALALAPMAALAQSQTTDQIPAPLPTAALTDPSKSELYIQNQSVSGGTLYTTLFKPAGIGAVPQVGSTTFVPVGATSPTRYLKLSDGKSDLGVPMTAAAGTPSGTVGISRTAGSSMVLVGEATSASAKTDKVIFEFTIPDTYIAGTSIPLLINANYTGGGTVTAASTTLTPTAYTESAAGVESAVTTSAAQQFTGTAATYTFTITGTSLVPGQRMVVEIVMLVTTSAGAATGQINSVAFQG
jgi:hypothetical protein